MELKIDKVIETVLYVSDIERADAFYRQVLKLPAMVANERFRAYNVGDRSVLLLFIEGDSLRGAQYPTGFIPAHDGVGPAHIGLAVAKEQLPHWERHLVANGVEIEGECVGNTAGRAFIFAIPTPTCWNW